MVTPIGILRRMDHVTGLYYSGDLAMHRVTLGENVALNLTYDPHIIR